MMAAIRAGELNGDVTLIEKNDALGRKLLLTGGGRCNFTNTNELGPFLEKFSGNGQFLRDAFKVFFSYDLIGFFKKRGIGVKVEDQGRVIPETERADTVIEILGKELQKNGVNVLFKKRLEKVVVKNDKVEGVTLSDGTCMRADKVILAAGGITYPTTGSSGEVFTILEGLGHKIVPTRVGLVPLKTREDYSALEGITLKDVSLKVRVDGRLKSLSARGDVLFTRAGISGPVVLSLSGEIADRLGEGKKVSVEMDIKPGPDGPGLDAVFARNPEKSVKNAIQGLVPQRFAEVILEAGKIGTAKKVNQLTIAEKNRLNLLFKAFPLDISGPGSKNEAMVTRGGVSLKEINPRTMESLKVKGLYFAGEMMDIDGDTGGYNLQAAFSTGYLAGQSALS